MEQSEKTVAGLEAELALLRKERTVDTIASVLATATGFGGLIAIVYFLNKTLEALPAGATSADIIDAFPCSTQLSWVLGLGGVIYGLRQRSRTRQRVAHFQARIDKLERSLDPTQSEDS